MTHGSGPDDRSPDGYDIVVIGAGIAGLVAAVTAVEGGARVALLDAVSPGGRAKTTLRNGYHLNTGPHALYLAGHLRPFLAARGIEPTGGPADAKSVRLLRDGALWPLSASVGSVARTKLLTPRSRLRILSLMARLPRMDTAPFVGRTWADWLADEPDDVAGVLAMFVRTGTYVNAAASFDAGAALDQFKLAMLGVRYIDNGWQTMVDALAVRFTAKGGTLFAGRSVTAVRSEGDVHLETEAGAIVARSVVLAGIGPDAVELITSASVRGRGDAGGPVHASALDLALRRVHSGLVFGIDRPLYLSPHAPTARLAPDGCGLVSLLRYTPDGEVGGPSPTEVKEQLHGLARQAGIDATDVVEERYLHRLVVANSFPAAHGGGLGGRPAIDAVDLPGVFIAGDWVGPRFQLADAASSSGEAASKRALAHVSGRRRVAI
ncbi:MAG: hypothetical protein JWN62_1012 [Acidimicrobiales bacterium]|nr:hypothetical protein [Acidimicrobiales bacterium]